MHNEGVAAEIAIRLQEDAPDTVASLKTPIQRLCAMNLPLAGRPDWGLTPSADTIVDKVKAMVGETATAYTAKCESCPYPNRVPAAFLLKVLYCSI